jgi:hypothetical protein
MLFTLKHIDDDDKKEKDNQKEKKTTVLPLSKIKKLEFSPKNFNSNWVNYELPDLTIKNVPVERVQLPFSNYYDNKAVFTSYFLLDKKIYQAFMVLTYQEATERLEQYVWHGQNTNCYGNKCRRETSYVDGVWCEACHGEDVSSEAISYHIDCFFTFEDLQEASQLDIRNFPIYESVSDIPKDKMFGAVKVFTITNEFLFDKVLDKLIENSKITNALSESILNYNVDLYCYEKVLGESKSLDSLKIQNLSEMDKRVYCKMESVMKELKSLNEKVKDYKQKQESFCTLIEIKIESVDNVLKFDFEQVKKDKQKEKELIAQKKIEEEKKKQEAEKLKQLNTAVHSNIDQIKSLITSSGLNTDLVTISPNGTITIKPLSTK